LEDTVVADPDFFEGAPQDGAGPQPHFFTISFIKDKTRIQDQLLKAFSSTVSTLAQNVPGVLVHCIQKDAKLPLLSSATDSNFLTTGMMARNYMFIPNPWSLQPGTQNKPKLPDLKAGKDGRQLFDENWGYNGLDRITAVMWIMAEVNVKDALDSLQMNHYHPSHNYTCSPSILVSKNCWGRICQFCWRGAGVWQYITRCNQ
jgi:hypothetical protein